ncbi:MAG: VOC family protein [Bacteroidota bacterium]
MKNYISILVLLLLLASCSQNKQNEQANQEISALRTELNSLKELQASSTAEGQLATFLTFQKEDAEQAMNFYVGLFENSKIDSIKRWGKEAPGKEGTIMFATFHLDGKRFICSDSPPIHEWDFTPAVSNFVDCKDEGQLQELFTKLAESGNVLMPPNNYGWSQKFAFVEDRFGVSWQLNLE